MLETAVADADPDYVCARAVTLAEMARMRGWQLASEGKFADAERMFALDFSAQARVWGAASYVHAAAALFNLAKLCALKGDAALAFKYTQRAHLVEPRVDRLLGVDDGSFGAMRGLTMAQLTSACALAQVPSEAEGPPDDDATIVLKMVEVDDDDDDPSSLLRDVHDEDGDDDASSGDDEDDFSEYLDDEDWEEEDDDDDV